MGDHILITANNDSPHQPEPKNTVIEHRIRALLRKSESTEFEAEATALISKAEYLRQRYRSAKAHPSSSGFIARETLVGVTAATQDNHRVCRVHIAAPWVAYQFQLLAVIAKQQCCAAALLTASGIATVLGESSDVDYVRNPFASVNKQMLHAMNRSVVLRQLLSRGEKSRYKKSLIWAYTQTVDILLAQAAHTVMKS